MSLGLCRACLTENAGLQSIRNTEFHEVYEKLSNSKLTHEDGRTETVCCTCYSHLQRCHDFSIMTQKANSILTQLYCDGIEISQADIAALQNSFDSLGSLENSSPNCRVQDYQPYQEVENECDSVKSESDLIDCSFSDITKIEDNLGNDSTCSGASMKKPVKKKKPFLLKENNHNIKRTLHADQSQRNPRKQVKGLQNATHKRKLNRDKTRSESGILKKHKSHSKAQSHVCTECNETFTRNNSLRKHMRSHTGRTYSCDKCYKTFAHNTNLNKHAKIHIEKKLSVCDRCGKSFIKAYQLKRHMRSHTGEKPYKCDKCCRTFSDRSNLMKHFVNHSEDNRSFVCTECNASFTQKNNLQRHMRSHTGETPFLCNICLKSLPDASLLKRHMRIHTGEKPYVCTTCGKAYSDKDNYKCHMRLHTGEKPYACKICDFKCAHATSLRYHLTKKHSES